MRDILKKKNLCLPLSGPESLSWIVSIMFRDLGLSLFHGHEISGTDMTSY